MSQKRSEIIDRGFDVYLGIKTQNTRRDVIHTKVFWGKNSGHI